MRKILKQILITLTVVVFTGCGTGDEGSSSGGNGKLIKVNDLLPEAAKNVLLKTRTSGSSVSEYFYDDKNTVVRMTYTSNGSLKTEYTIENEYNGDGLITKTTRTAHNINPEYKTTLVAKAKYKNKRLDTLNAKSELESIYTEPESTVSKTKVLKRKGSVVTEYVTKGYDDDKNLLSTSEIKLEVNKLKKTREDMTKTYSKHAKKSAGETYKLTMTYEYDDTLNTIKPHAYGAEENAYINNAISGIYIPSKITSYYDNQRRAVITNTFEFDSNGLMTKRIENGTVITYTYIDKN